MLPFSLDRLPGSPLSFLFLFPLSSAVPAEDTPPAAKKQKVDPPASRSQEDNDKFNCVICFEKMTPPAAIPCGHVFCEACVKNWVKAHQKCPTCRKKVKAKDITVLFF